MSFPGQKVCVPPPIAVHSRRGTFLILALHVEEGGGALLVTGLACNHATVLPEVPHSGRVDRQRAILADRRPPLQVLHTNFPLSFIGTESRGGVVPRSP